jgi:ABC-type branched-subunit amino acid transport system substrate-binding protein
MGESSMKSRSALPVVLLVCAALFASACGTRADEDEAIANQDDTEETDDTTDGTTDGTDSGPAELNDPLFPTDEDGQIMFGSVPSPCGEGDASTATDIGVTEDSIEIHSIADPGAPVEGLNEGIHDGIAAFVDWCNEQGGVNGRTLELVLSDAALFQVKERTEEACDQAFALVGSGAAFDRDGAQTAVDCGIVDVPAFTVYPEKAMADRMVQPMPNPTDSFGVGPAQWIAEEYPETIESAAALYIATGDVAQDQSDRIVQAYEQVGYDFVLQEGLTLGETNWGPVISSMEDAGVQYLTYTGVYQEFVNLQTAMRDQGLEIPVVEVEANLYNQDYAETAGGAADGTLVRTTIWPFEEADLNPATQQFLNVLAEYRGDVDPELLGVHAFSAGLLFATALKELGDEVTRDALLEKLLEVHEWDGGGLHRLNDPGANESSTCFIMLEIQDEAFQRRYPDEGYSCPEDGSVPIEGYEGLGATEAG